MEKWHPWLFEEFYTLNVSKGHENENFHGSEIYQSQTAPLSPSKNKLNLNFTFTNEKSRKMREEDFFNDLQKRLDINTDDIRRIKENLDGFRASSVERSERSYYPNNFSPKLHLDKSFFDERPDKKMMGSKGEEFLNYLESLKNYKAEAISKTLNFNRRKRSAILIQKAFRGFVVRKAYIALKTKTLLERCKKILFMKKREYIHNNAMSIIMKHMKKFVKKLQLRKKLIFKKFINHCARLIQRFFKFRVKPFYKIKLQQYQQKHFSIATHQKKPSQSKSFKNQTPDFSVIKHESNYSSLRATTVLDPNVFVGGEVSKKKSFEEPNKWDMRENMPIKGSSGKQNNINGSEHINLDSKTNNQITEESEAITEKADPNKWEERENMPVGGSKNKDEMNKWEQRENMPVGGSKNKDEMNKWEQRENMPIGGSKNKGDMFGGGEFADPNYVPSNKKPVKKREFLKRDKNKISGKKEEEQSVSENLKNSEILIKITKPSESEEKPKSHFKNFSKNLSEINTNLLNNSMTEENRELTNTLSALTYESPLKTNFKKKSQLFSPAMNVSGRSTPMKSESPEKQSFLKKKKQTPKTTKKEDNRSVSMKKSKETTTEEDESKEKQHHFLKRRTNAVVSQKLNWKNIQSRTDCGRNRKSPPSSANKTSESQKPGSFNKNNKNNLKSSSQIGNKNANSLNSKKKQMSGFLKTQKKGEVRETIMIKNPEDDLRERMAMVRNQNQMNQMENDYTASNFTLTDNLPSMHLSTLPGGMQLRPQTTSAEGLTINDQNQLNQLILMSSLELRNNMTNTTKSENKREVSTLSGIYKGSESSINSSVKMERPLAVEELERAYRTNYFGKLTSLLLISLITILFLFF